eukprot:766088-Hanusia_phi.AAC.3
MLSFDLAEACEAEVSDLDVSAEVEEDVLGLEVPVDDAFGVDVGDPRDDLPKEIPEPLRSLEESLVGDYVRQRLFTVLHLYVQDLYLELLLAQRQPRGL